MNGGWSLDSASEAWCTSPSGLGLNEREGAVARPRSKHEGQGREGRRHQASRKAEGSHPRRPE